MHAKYIMKKGRKHGPYFYTTIRMPDGRVISNYLGTNKAAALKKERELRAFHEMDMRKRHASSKLHHTPSDAYHTGLHRISRKHAFKYMVPVLLLVAISVMFALQSPTGMFTPSDYEQMHTITADSTYETIAYRVVFDQYKPTNCADGILVTEGDNPIQFTTNDEIYDNNTCQEVTIQFNNLVFNQTGQATEGNILTAFATDKEKDKKDKKEEIATTTLAIPETTITESTIPETTIPQTTITETSTEPITTTIPQETTSSESTIAETTTELTTTELTSTSTIQQDTTTAETTIETTVPTTTTMEEATYNIYYGRILTTTIETTTTTINETTTIPLITINETTTIPTTTINVTTTIMNETTTILNETTTTINENVTLQTPLKLQELISRANVTIGVPVEWITHIIIEEGNTTSLTVNITRDATDISVIKIEDNQEQLVADDKIKVNDDGTIKDKDDYEKDKKIEIIDQTIALLQEQKQMTASDDVLENTNDRISTLSQEKSDLQGGITGLLTGWVTAFFENPMGMIINEETGQTEIILNEPVNQTHEIEISYETPGPEVLENILSANEKIINVTTIGDVHYTNVLAYTRLINEVSSENDIALYRTTDGSYDATNFVATDTNNDGLLDTIYWIVPSLSSQTYIITDVSSAASTNLTANNITAEANITHLSLNDSSIFLYYPMDDNVSLTKVYDYSGNNNDGTITGGVNSVSGMYGKGLGFNGIDSKVATGSDFIKTNAVTVCSWIYPTTWGPVGLPYARIVDNGNFLFLVYGSTGTTHNLNFYSDGSTLLASAQDSISLNAWQDVCVARNSTGWAWIYINGVLNVNGSSGTPTAGTTNVIIGNNNAASRTFNGTIDDVIIYNRTLSNSEVSALYQNQTARFYSSGMQTFKFQNFTQNGAYNKFNMTINSQQLQGSSLNVTLYSINQSNPTYNDGGSYNADGSLTGYWHLDGNALDYSGYGNNGTLSGGVTNTTGYFGNAYGFDGASRYVDVGSGETTSPLAAQANETISAWIYSKQDKSNAGIVTQAENGGAYTSRGIIIISGSLEFFSRNSATDWQDVTNSYSLNQWYHVVLVQTNNNLSGYVNGAFIGSVDMGSNRGGHYYSWHRIGAYTNDATLAFNGTIDDVMIFNRSLTATEISELYTTGNTNHANNGIGIKWTNQGTQPTTNLTWNIPTTESMILPQVNFFSDNYGFYSPIIMNNITLTLLTEQELPVIYAHNLTVAYDFPLRLAVLFNFTDNNATDSFSVNDTVNFKINKTGYLENATALNAQTYWLKITANDSSNNTASTGIWVNVTICGQGDTESTCNITTAKTIRDGLVVSANNMIIKNGGSLTNTTSNCSGTNHGCSFSIQLTGNLTVQSGGSINVGNVSIAANNVWVLLGGKIDTSTLGFIKGTGPGAGVGDDAGGGGGHGGVGGYSWDGSGEIGGSSYGSYTAPVTFGSGGANYADSGSGGGVVFINATDIALVNGTVSAEGQNATGVYRTSGAGGSIWIISNTFNGTGMVNTRGGSSTANGAAGGAGGGGRIAVLYNNYGFSGNFSAAPGAPSDGCAALTYGQAEPGSLYLSNFSSLSDTLYYSIGLPFAFYNLQNKNLTLLNGVTLSLYGNTSFSVSTLMLNGGSKMIVMANLTDNTSATINAQNLIIQTGAVITGDGYGYYGGTGPGAGVGDDGGGGGGHGGPGGTGGDAAWEVGGGTYGSATQPVTLGSGGSKIGNYNSSGGSAVKINVSALVINGTISFNGKNTRTYNGIGGGAGGSIWIITNNLTGNGNITATGKAADAGGGQGGGGGGGGRIAIYYQSMNFSGVISAASGKNYVVLRTQPGSGTIYINGTNTTGNFNATVSSSGIGGMLNFTGVYFSLTGTYLANGTATNGTIKINCTDCTSNLRSATFTPSPLSSCGPVITTHNLSLEYPANVSVQFNFTDDIATDSFSVNDTTRFQINKTGFLFNKTDLQPMMSPNLHWLTITVNDSSNNTASVVIWINITDTTTPNITFSANTEANGTLYNRNNAFVNVSVSDANNVTTFVDFDNSLVSWWRFEGGSLADYTTRNNGTITGTITATANGMFGSAYSFNGDSSNYISKHNPVSLALSANGTLSAWVYPKSSGTTQTIISKMANTGCGGIDYYMYIDDTGKPFFGLLSPTCIGGTVKSSSTVPLNQWSLVTATFQDGTENIYVNGVNKGTTTGNPNAQNVAVDLFIGALIPSWYGFNGTIDDVMIFNRSLSAVEVTGLYANLSSKYLTVNYTSLADGLHTFKAYVQDIAGNVNDTGVRSVTVDTITPNITFSANTEANGSAYSRTNAYVNVSVSDTNNVSTFIDFDNSLVSWYRFEGNALDYTTRNNGTLSGTITNTTGKFGNALSFDGTSGYITFSGLNLNANTKETFSAWIKSPVTINSGTPNQQRILQSNRNTVGFGNVALGGSNNKLCIVISPSAGQYSISCSNQATWNANQWYFITATWNGTQQIIYIDGVLDKSQDQTYTGGFATTGNSYLSFTSEFFNGTIDDVMIFNRSLSQAEITGLYANTSSKYLTMNYTALADGVHTFKAYVEDIAGNVNTTELRSVTTDTVIPGINYVSPSPANNTYTNATVYLNATVSDANSKAYAFFDDGLVGWWRMEGNALDTSALGNNGTLSGGVTNTTGMIGNAYNFNGNSNNYISTTASTSLQLSTNITISAWVKPAAFTNSDPGIVAKRSSDGCGGIDYGLYLSGNTGTVVLQALTPPCSGTTVTSTNPIQLNRWTHIVGTMQDGNYTIYINGNLDKNSGGGVNAGNQVSTLYTGVRYPGTGGFNGTIDDVMIFNRSLSDSEIRALYNATQHNLQRNLTLTEGSKAYTAQAVDSAGNMNTSAISFTVDFGAPIINFSNPTPANNSAIAVNYAYINVTTTDGNLHYAFVDWNKTLVGWWRFENNSLDSSTYGNNGTLSGGVTNTTGKFGNAYGFDGTSGKVNVLNSSNLNFGTGNFSISAWVYPNSWVDDGGILGKSTTTGSAGVDYAIASRAAGGFEFYVGNNMYRWSNIGKSAKNWYHVVAIYNGTNSMWVYVNGVREDGGLSGGTKGSSNTANLTIGGWSSTGTYFNGTIDDVMIFNRALNASEISALYNATVSQYYNNFTTLADGAYTYKAYAVDIAGNVSSTDLRALTIDTITPNITFSANTEANGSAYGRSNAFVNVSVVDANNVTTFVDWDNSLLGWWRMEGNANDYTSRYNGSLLGTVTNATGKFGNAYNFLTSSCLNTGLLTSQINRQNFTISVWFKQTAVDAGVGGFLWTTYQWGLFFYNGHISLNTLDGDANSFGNIPSTVTDWHLYTVVISNSTNGTKLYIDGNFIGNASYRETGYPNWFLFDDFYTGQHFTGFYDDAMIFNRSLTAPEVVGLYANQTSKYLAVNYTSLTDGLHTFKAYVQDIAGNVNTTDLRSVRTDTTAPTFTNIANLTVNDTQHWGYDINATDNYLFDSFSINNTLEFQINRSSGLFSNNTRLIGARQYWVDVTVNDSLNNTKTVSIWVNVSLTNREPNLTIPVITPAAAFTNTTLNASTTTWDYDMTNNTVAFKWFVNGALVLTNYVYNVTNNSLAWQTLPVGYYVKHDNVVVEVHADDSITNSTFLNSTTTLINNWIITAAPTLTDPANNTMKVYTNDTLYWTNTSSLDVDNDVFSYVLQIATDKAFTNKLFNGTIAELNYTNETLPDQLLNNSLYWRVRSFDGDNYSDWSAFRNVSVIQARIAFTAPSNNLTTYPGASYNIVITETNHTEWTSSVKLYVYNDNLNSVYTMTKSSDNDSVWSYLYTVPETLPARVLSIRAYGYNDTTENVSTFMNLRVTRPVGTAVGAPNITMLRANVTNALPGSSVNVTMTVRMDTLMVGISLNLTYPNSTSVIVTPTMEWDDNTNFRYNRSYIISAPLNGTYTLHAAADDINGQTTNRYEEFFAHSAQNIEIKAIGAESMEILDKNSEYQFATGTDSISTTLPYGKYDVRAILDHPVVTFNNITLNSTVDENNTVRVILRYNNTAESLSPPSSRRSVDQFIINSTADFGWIDFEYNYTYYINTISDQDNLELWRLNESNQWEEKSVKVYKDIYRVNTTLSNFSYWLLAESAAPVPVVVYTAGGGGNVYRSVSSGENYQLDMIVPALMSMGQKDSVDAPLILRNTARSINMTKITITASSETDDLSFEFAESSWPVLKAGERVNTTLVIFSHTDPKRYNVTIVAKGLALTPEGPQEVIANRTIVIDLTPFTGSAATVYDNLIFARNLFAENPECYELSELLQQAETALNNSETGKAVNMVDSAVNACRDLMKSLGKELRMPVTKIDLMLLAIITAIASLGIFVYLYVKHLDETRKKAHTATLQHKMMCKHCGRYFADESSLQRHIKLKHSGK